ncbi:unnamed protein product [Parnassius apollo]|uniref:tRNA pseudouridine(55) synthase n=1 Tax=Parnassius apollo TaxID=110799 RepID=A0A8S3WAT3_PARAO|nr:unnamed protein product [Parnassius apollo]
MEVDQNNIFKLCKELGCCDACCLRYLGLKNPSVYENTKNVVAKYEVQEIATKSNNCDETIEDSKKNILEQSNIESDVNGDSYKSPPSKKRKIEPCVTCLGILQEETWADSFEMVKEVLEKKRYACDTFACALSAPMATILRERVVGLHLEKSISHYDANALTPLKEAWKWSFGTKLAAHIGKTLDSGAVSPLLVTLNIDYLDDLQELEALKTIATPLFESRSQQRKRFSTEFTRRAVEQALQGVTLETIQAASESCCLPQITAPAKCVSVVCTHAPMYLGGRYIKLSRELPQTPWIVGGRRVMPSSVQEIIFQPLAELYGMSAAEAERRLKLVAAGREDVDVRCLGDGRPFAIEIIDPQRQLTSEELAQACKLISSGGEVIVKELVPIVKEDLALLKKGEECKTKTYHALCIKLSHSEFNEVDPDSPITVTDADLERINSYRNTKEGDEAKIEITQKTPIRVLHRRPLLTRTRHLLELHAEKVPDHAQLFYVRVRTSAGTYVKEWAHGELRRTRPALPNILHARTDLLALDVAAVHLCWPHAPVH